MYTNLKQQGIEPVYKAQLQFFIGCQKENFYKTLLVSSFIQNPDINRIKNTENLLDICCAARIEISISFTFTMSFNSVLGDRPFYR